MLRLEKAEVKTFSLLGGAFFPGFMAFNLILANLTFAAGGVLSWWQIVAAFFGCLFLLGFAAFRLFDKNKIRNICLLLVFTGTMTVLAVIVSGYFFDISYDGRRYHQNSVIQLATGWNPTHNPYNPDGKSPRYEPLKPSAWSVVYPKSAEINAAALYKLTGRIEQGKAFNGLLMISALLLTFTALLSVSQLKTWIALLFAAMATLNPVVLTTLLSYHVDGQLASVLTCLFALAILVFREKKTLPLFILPAVLIVAINTKFTGLAYSFFIVLGLTAGLLLKRDFKYFSKTAASCLLAGLIGFAGVGFNPYITNWRHYGHPLHPIFGKNQMKGLYLKRFLSIPQNLDGRNRFVKFFISQASRSENSAYPNQNHRVELYSTRLKIPFSIEAKEIAQFRGPQARSGGFGPWFGGVLLLIFPILIGGFLLDFKRYLPYFAFFLLVAVTMAINREFWSARLAPQGWLIPFIFLFFLVQDHFKKRLPRYFAILLISLLVINTVLIIGSYFSYQFSASTLLHNKLQAISRLDRPIEVDMGGYQSTRVTFTEAGIQYSETSVEDFPKSSKILSLGHGIKYVDSHKGE